MMTHYLANLVDRNLGQTAVVRPRPISRFESQVPVSMAEAADLTAAEPTVAQVETNRPFANHVNQTQPYPPQEQADDPTQRQALSARLDTLSSILATYREQRPPAAPVTPLAPASPQARSNPEAVATTHPSDAEQARATADHTHHPGPDSLTKAQHTGPGRVTPVAQPASSPAPELTRPAKKQPAVANQLLPQGVAGPVSSQPVSPPIATAEQPGTVERRLSQPPAMATPAVVPQVGTSADVAPTILRPQIVSIPTPVAGPARQSSAVKPPPTINVTIGRIEVKATPAPPPAARKPTRQPPSQPKAMSLDEYLRRRNGESG